ncbi:hypothetical protein HZC09_05445 [Candidatus Micrarchaeota archaeon]|nr:hypothetical protein [Candidatus Micrarchaeota archaeon]
MVSKQAILKYGALALILFFVLGFFVPLMYVQQPPSTASEASPEPQTLKGMGKTTANVTRLEYVGYAQCPSSNASYSIKQVPGVKNAFLAASGALAVEFSPETLVGELSAKVQVECGSAMFRTALLDLEPVLLNFTNKSFLLSKYMLQGFAGQNGLPYLRGFVLSDTTQGSSINVSVYGVISGNALSSLTIEESRRQVVWEMVKAPEFEAKTNETNIEIGENNETIGSNETNDATATGETNETNVRVNATIEGDGIQVFKPSTGAIEVNATASEPANSTQSNQTA